MEKTAQSGPRRAIVLGGYGLIGSVCMARLSKAGFAVTGIGRSETAAMAASPDMDWLIRDITKLSVDEWHALIKEADVIVNASGALQDGALDNLEAIHVTAVSRLVEAARDQPLRIVQISAAGVAEDASTAFLRTKAQGDAIISKHSSDWVILRPTLVLSHEAYGGTALLRAAAAIPFVLPHIFPKAPVQTIHVGDVADAVVAAAEGKTGSGLIADLTEPEAQYFPDLIAAVRRWQGWPAPLCRLAIPELGLKAMGLIADGLGHLGWRSPFRSTALLALKDGIRGDPGPWEKATGQRFQSLKDTLALLPVTRQERLFARAYLALPLAIATLALFWCLSGLITFLNLEKAIGVLTERALAGWLAGLVVIGGALADLCLGLAILWRGWTRLAAFGMLGLSTCYLLGSLIVAPDLWSDPLGPMVKVFPGMGLAALVWLLMEDR